MAEDADDGVPDDVVIVHLRRRTLPEQVEWLIMQVSFMVARLGTMERDAAALREDVEALTARLKAVERAAPWMNPKKHTGPPRDPLDQPRHFPFAHSYEEAMAELEIEMKRIREQQRKEGDPDDG